MTLPQKKSSRFRSPFIARAMAVALLSTLLACAAPQPKTGQGKALFSDPGQFESLASGAFESPAPAVATVGTPAVDSTKDFNAQSLISGTAPLPTASVAGVQPPSHDVDLSARAIASAPIHPAPETVTTPEGAFSNLILGNDRFVTGAVKGEHRDGARRRALASGQSPSAIILSCSDSRVPPELIFDQGLGDIFTIRVAGNVVGSAQVASIEYAIEHLGAKLIVVLGHESCGAVKAALQSKPKVSSGSTDLDWLVGEIKPNLKSRGIASAAATDPNIRQPVMANVDAVTEQLLVRSKIVTHAMHEGHLKVVRGIYSLESGKVDFWGLK